MKIFFTIMFLALFVCSGGSALLAQDDCDPFKRGDANNDGSVNLSDVVYINNWLFHGGPAPDNRDAADVNDDRFNNATDPVYLNNYLFQGGPPPAAPFPGAGFDCTGDGLDTCCSSPTGQVFGKIFQLSGTAIIDDFCSSFDVWDIKSGSYVSDKEYAWTWGNNANCDHNQTCAIQSETSFDLASHSFTASELYDGVITLRLHFTVGWEIKATTPCMSNSDELNELELNSENMSVVFGVAKVGQPYTGVAGGFNTSLPDSRIIVQYTITDNHIEYSGDNRLGTATANIDVSEVIADIIDNDCSEWRVDHYSIDNLNGYFRRPGGDDDLAEKEEIKVTIGNTKFEYLCN